MKKCTVCKIKKNLSEFDKKGFNKNGEQRISSHCKECRKIYVTSHYKNNIQSYVLRAKKNNDITQKKCEQYIRTLTCIDCNFSFVNYPNVCDFHHTKNNKESNVSKLKRHSFKKFMSEVNKCIPLCSNCHRIRHARLA